MKTYQLSEEERAYFRRYYQEKKERINQIRYQKYQCPDCGGSYSSRTRRSHERTQKHRRSLDLPIATKVHRPTHYGIVKIHIDHVLFAARLIESVGLPPDFKHQ